MTRLPPLASTRESGATVKFEGVNRSLAQAFADGAAAHPHARIVVASAVRPADCTMAELYSSGLRFGAHLHGLGIGPGDIVAVQLPAWAEWLVAAIGIAHAGAVLLPIVSIYGAREVSFILRQSQAKIIVTPDVWRKTDYGEMAEAMRGSTGAFRHVVIGSRVPDGALGWEAVVSPIAATKQTRRGPDDLALLVYTSGTTADPKGVQHTARTLLSEMASNALANRGTAREIAFSPWPPGHVAGAIGLLRTIVHGASMVMMDEWDPASAADLIERYRPNSSGFTPFHLAGLLDAADGGGKDISSLQRVTVGATTVPPQLIERCEARGLPTVRSYGSSELPTLSRGEPDDPLAKRLTTEGRLLPGCEVRFLDEDGTDAAEGELIARAPELFVGYLDPRLDEGTFLPGGWFRTGDVGRLDEDGYLLITDRKKDIIIRGGENISSREVEDLLARHPDIQEASIVAAPDARMGEVVCAFVVGRAGTVIDLLALRRFFAEAGIARQKTPERLVLVDGLPRNATGKVLKHELRLRAANGAST